MNKSFRINKSLRIKTLFTSILFTVLIVSLIYLPFTNEEPVAAAIIVTSITAFTLSIIIGVLLASAFRPKITFKEKSIFYSGIFSKMVLSFNQIKGFKFDKNDILLIPKPKGLKPIRIKNFENPDQIRAIAIAYFDNLN